MGLDMYLQRKVYVGAYFEHRKVTGRIEIYEDGRPIDIDFSKVRVIVEQVGYWRKVDNN